MMHELAVTQSILSIVLDALAEAGGGRITAVDLMIGDLSGYVDDSVQFYFDVLSEETPAAGARLRFHRQPARAQCVDCGHEFDVSPPLDPTCPVCRGTHVRVSGGTNFYVESIEVEYEDPGRERDSAHEFAAGG